jgi:hypothetical protein
VKWKACIAILVLTLTLVVPAAQSLFSEPEVTVFIIDEEKGSTEGKIFSPTEEHLPAYHEWDFAQGLSMDRILISQLPVDRALELQTPPPDVC